MNGGVDGIVNTLLSAYTPMERIESGVKRAICAAYAGELPVGASVTVRPRHPNYTHLIYAPTMRVDVSGSLNAYLAFRAALLAASHAGCRDVSAPLFCTGSGSMSVERVELLPDFFVNVI